MKNNDFIVIKGLTLKTKNRIRNHGNEWRVLDKQYNLFLLMETQPKDLLTPYCFWGEPGIDFEILK